MDCHFVFGYGNSRYSYWFENQCLCLLIFFMFFFSGEFVFARCLSSLKDERVKASGSLKGPSGVKFEGNKAEMVEHIRQVSLGVFFCVSGKFVALSLGSVCVQDHLICPRVYAVERSG